MRTFGHPPQFLRFALVGGLMTGLNLGWLALLTGPLGLGYLLACTISYFILNAVGYLANRVLAFKPSHPAHRAELLRYYLVMAASLGANLGLMAIFVDGFGLEVLQASVLVTLLLALVNYFGHSVYTFKQHERN